MIIRKIILILLSFFLVSCGPSSLEEYREQGEGITRSLIKEMQAIHTHEDLLEAKLELTRLYSDLAKLMVAAKKFQVQHNCEPPEMTEMDHQLSDQLREEMNRIFGFDGGREMIELYQREGYSFLNQSC